MTRRHLTLLFVAPLVAMSIAPLPSLAAGGMMHVPQSLLNDSEHPGPLIPEFGYKKKLKKAAKKVDPMKAIRTRMIAGKKVTDKELRSLAKSGDDLGQYYYGKRLEDRGDPEADNDTAGGPRRIDVTLTPIVDDAGERLLEPGIGGA